MLLDAKNGEPTEFVTELCDPATDNGIGDEPQPINRTRTGRLRISRKRSYSVVSGMMVSGFVGSRCSCQMIGGVPEPVNPLIRL